MVIRTILHASARVAAEFHCGSFARLPMRKFGVLALLLMSMSDGDTMPNKPDTANPAVTLLFQAGHHWRGVADSARWAA
jgi:hypothetical protein